MSRGIIYIVWPGSEKTEPMLQRSIASANLHHPELPHEIIRLPDGASLLDKSRMAYLTMFDETLFLDVDTIVLGNLDYGFEKAAQHGMALCINECPWARRYGELKDRGDITEFNTGVLFFTKESCHVFDAWNRLAGIDSKIIFRTAKGITNMPFNDQAGFAAAIEETGFNPWILPCNWNFRPIWQRTTFGEVKIWHDYSEPTDSFLNWNKSQIGQTVIEYARLT